MTGATETLDHNNISNNTAIVGTTRIIETIGFSIPPKGLKSKPSPAVNPAKTKEMQKPKVQIFSLVYLSFCRFFN